MVNLDDMLAMGHTFVFAQDKMVSEEQYVFGMSLLEYLGSNPITRVDPLGEWFYVGFDAMFSVGSAFGGLYAANALELRTNYLRSFAKWLGAMAVRKPTQWLTKQAVELADPRTVWEAMHTARPDGILGKVSKAVGGGIGGIKSAIGLLAGFAYGQTAYTIFTVCEDMYHGQASYLPGF